MSSCERGAGPLLVVECGAWRKRAEDAEARLERALAMIYRLQPYAVAVVCDDVLDRSGALLGRVRDLDRGGLFSAPATTPGTDVDRWAGTATVTLPDDRLRCCRCGRVLAASWQYTTDGPMCHACWGY